MLIRSQDKKKLLSIENTMFLDTGNGKQICAQYPNNETLVIGEYSTEEKAINVLDQIQEVYETSLYSDHAFDHSAVVERPYVFASNKVFQIPKDEDFRI